MEHPVLFQVAVNKPNANPQADKPDLFIVSSDRFIEFQQHLGKDHICVIERFPDHCLLVSDEYFAEH